jgi:hypothetical protein
VTHESFSMGSKTVVLTGHQPQLKLLWEQDGSLMKEEIEADTFEEFMGVITSLPDEIGTTRLPVFGSRVSCCQIPK